MNRHCFLYVAVALGGALHGTLARAEIVEFRPEVTNLAGQPVDVMQVGEEFLFRVLVADVRDDPIGVFSAYLDVEYDEGLVSYVPDSLAHSGDFDLAVEGDASTPGLIDEVGGISIGVFDDTTRPPIGPPLGPGSFLLFVAGFKANAQGNVTFSGNPPENLPLHETTVHGLDHAVSFDEIVFRSASVTIVPEPSTLLLMILAIGGIRLDRHRP